MGQLSKFNTENEDLCLHLLVNTYLVATTKYGYITIRKKNLNFMFRTIGAGVVVGDRGTPKILADQLTLFKPDGAVMLTT